MKIIQINAVNKIGSTGRTSYEMSRFLNKIGNSSVTAYSTGQEIEANIEYKIGCRVDTKLHGLMSRISGMQGYFSHHATKKLLAFMDEYKPDIAVLRNLHANYINLPMLLSYLAKKDIATVVVLHDCWLYTGKCCHYTVQGCYKWKEGCGNCPQLKKHNKSWFFDRTGYMLKDKIRLFGNIKRLAVVGVSDWILNQAKQSPVFKHAKVIKKIYNWIDTDMFSHKNVPELKAKLGVEDKKVILCVANIWNKDKGLDLVSDLSKQLNDDEKIILVGRVDNYEIDKDILHISWTDSIEELAEYYSMADVFLQPSLEETFGKVTAEVLSCGTPVVCFDSTANPELVGKGCGAIVPAGDTDKLLEEIRRILKNGKAQYALNCREFVQSNFLQEPILNEYVDLFKQIIL